jgi:hypothetical protein
VRDTGKIFEFINDIKEIFDNINFFTSIYSNTGTGIENIKFLKKYKMPIERAGREIITDIKNSARPLLRSMVVAWWWWTELTQYS